MKQLVKSKAKGIKKDLIRFIKKLDDIKPGAAYVGELINLAGKEMKSLSFDDITIDRAGNLIGVVRGYEKKRSVLMLSHIDVEAPGRQRSRAPGSEGLTNFKAGIISSIYAAALIKNTMLPLGGDLIVSCVPRLQYCDSEIRYLFDGFSKKLKEQIKGIILCEPTDFDINIGNKGRMEYEIVIKGRLGRDFPEHRGVNMLGAAFPLINELEKVSKELPSDFNLGRSDLKIKDVRYSGYKPRSEMNEFRIVVDRKFIPEENEDFILNKARSIARIVYKQDPEVKVNALLAKQRIKTYTGLELASAKNLKPWSMESHQPFVLESLQSLVENGFKSKIGYWKKIITEGAYTYNQLGIPTIGFGAGSEDIPLSGKDLCGTGKIEKAAYGQALIVLRNIGMPTFGWSPNEI